MAAVVCFIIVLLLKLINNRFVNNVRIFLKCVFIKLVFDFAFGAFCTSPVAAVVFSDMTSVFLLIRLPAGSQECCHSLSLLG
jgi:hypothetical protein